MAGESFTLSSIASIVDAQALAVYGIAINLAYLNLPNLRFPERIKAKIREVFRRYDDAQLTINATTASYRTIYELANLSEFRHLNLPIAPYAQKNGGFLVNVFMFIWCTSVQISYASQPVDKLISASFLCVSNLYLCYFTVLQVSAQDINILESLFLAFEVCIAAIVAVSFLKYDIVTGIITGLGLLGCHLSVYYPDVMRFIPAAGNRTHAVILLIASVLTTTALVAFSHMLYPIAERHFIQLTNDILEDAKGRAALKQG